MSDKNNNSDSPIRGLFRKNEEEYKKNQQLNQENTDTNNLPENEKKEEKINIDRFKEGLNSFLSAITAPEDESDFDFDDIADEDIFSGGNVYAAKNSYMNKPTNNQFSEPTQKLKRNDDYTTYTDPEPDPVYISADLMQKKSDKSSETKKYSESVYSSYGAKNEVDNELNYDDGLYADLTKHDTKYDSKQDTKLVNNINTADNISNANNSNLNNSDDENVIYTNPINSSNVQKKNFDPNKMEITLDDIMRAKNMGIENKKITLDLSSRSMNTQPDDTNIKNNQKLQNIPIILSNSEEEPSEDNENEIVYAENNIKTQQTDEFSKENGNADLNVENKIKEDEDVTIVDWQPDKENEKADYTEIDEEKLPPINPQPVISQNQNTEKLKNTETENHNARKPMRYSVDKTEPFIVMAGKFTNTVRSEYERIRRYNEQNPQNIQKPVYAAARNINQNGQKSASQPISNPQQHRSQRPNQTNKSNPSNQSKYSPAKNSAPKKQPQPKKIEKTSEKKIGKKIEGFFKSIFSSQELYDDDSDDGAAEERPQLDDYRNTADIQSIKDDIGDNLYKVAFRLLVLSIDAIISIIICALLEISPEIFSGNKNGWLVYGIINFILLTIAVFTGQNTIINGFAPIKHFRFNAETPISFAAIACFIQSITAMFTPSLFVNGSYHLYSSILVISLFLNHLGKFFIIARTGKNFKFFVKSQNKFAGKIYTDEYNAERFSQGLPIRPIIAYPKKSKNISNFLQLSYSPDPVEEVAAAIAPFGIICSIVCGILYGVVFSDLIGGICSFAVTSCITSPMCCLIAVNIPLKRICSDSIKNGAMIVGYETVKQFCDTNAVMLDTSQLFPPGSIYINGVKTFNQAKFYDALRSYAAVMVSVKSPVQYAFDKFIPEGVSNLPKVESVIYDDGCGLTAWLNDQRVLIGNRSLFEKHNIKIPEGADDEKYKSEGKEPVYVSVGGEIVVMFMLIYKTDMKIARELRNLGDNGVNFIFRNIDQVITEEFIAEKFKLYPRCVKILPTGLGNICNEELTSKEPNSRAYLVTDGKLSSFAHAVANCISVKLIVPMLRIIQSMSIAFGAVLVTSISFMSGFSKLGELQLMVYIVFWCAAAVISSAVIKKFIK